MYSPAFHCGDSPSATYDSGIEIAGEATGGGRAGRRQPVYKAPVYYKAPPRQTELWNWSGLYVGAHIGGASDVAHFADPFGSSVYGDVVRSTGFFGGGQIGYNWQAPGSRWLLGLEVESSRTESDGTNTCFAASSSLVNATCRVRPYASAALTGRVVYALGPSGATLVYGKGGFAWAKDDIEMALNAGGNNQPGARRSRPTITKASRSGERSSARASSTP